MCPNEVGWAIQFSSVHYKSSNYKVCMYLCKMTADPGATMLFVADNKKPVGGHILAVHIVYIFI